MRNIIMVIILIMVTCACSQQKIVTKKTHVWEIRITNDHEQLVCISRLTVAVIDKK